ncbi:hypothetical protein GGH96_003075 [Coemansia sp. RSA 1972]|nr:hypothetical protein GGH96_003075 [Coemansia sp. RSA 1972]
MVEFKKYVAKYYKSASEYDEVVMSMDPISTMDMVRDEFCSKVGESANEVLFVLGEMDGMSLHKCDVLVLSDHYSIDYCRHCGETLNILLKQADTVQQLKSEWNESLNSEDTKHRTQLLELLKPQ